MNSKHSAIALAAVLVITWDNALAYEADGGTANNTTSIAIGNSAKAGYSETTESSVAVGKKANATGYGTIAIGEEASASYVSAQEKSTHSIAIGYQATVNKTRGIAIGSQALVEGHESYAIGTETQATKGYTLALGNYAKALSYRSIAIGASAAVGTTDAEAQYGVALGADTSVTVDYGLAIGTGSVSDRARYQAGYDPLTKATMTGTSLTPAWESQRGAVSVGSGSGDNEKTRQIIHVAAGSEDTDAVNVAQLKASQTTLTLASGESSLNLTKSATTSGGTSYELSLDTSALQSTEVAAGTGVSVSQSGSTYKVTLNSNQTFGTVTATKFNVGSVTLNNTGLTLTSGPSLTTSGISAGGKTISNVLMGTLDTDAVNVAQLKASQSSLALESGESNLEITSSSSDAGTSYTIGIKDEVSFSKVTATDSMSIGSSLTLSGSNIQVGSSVTLSTTGLAITSGPTVTTTGISAGNLEITAVANGKNDTDAVNVGQLNETVKNNKSSVAGGSGISVSQAEDAVNGGTKYTVSLNSAISFDSVTTTSLVIGTSDVNLTNQGLTLGTSGPYFTTSGISAGGQQINNVLAGVADTDAVNVGQLNKSKSDLVLASGTTNLTLNSTADANGTHYELGLSESLEFDRVTAGNTTISSDGFSITGGPSVTDAGINASNKTISNVAAGTQASDAVNKGQMETYVEQKKTTVTAGTGISIAETHNVNGGTDYEVSLAGDISFDSVSSGDTKISNDGVSIVNGPSMKKTGIDAAGTKVTQVADGESDTDAVNVSQLNKAKSRVKAKENGNLKVTSTSSENGTEYEVSLEDSVAVNEVQVGENVHLSSEGIRVGEGGAAMTENGFDAGGNVISNVAAGVLPTDAVNLSQMNSTVNNIYRQIHSVDKDARAGIAMAIATAGLPQAYLPGKSMFAISGGTYRGQSGYAIGFSHVTDKGRVIIKATGSGNSQGHFGGSVGVGWQW